MGTITARQRTLHEEFTNILPVTMNQRVIVCLFDYLLYFVGRLSGLEYEKIEAVAAFEQLFTI